MSAAERSEPDPDIDAQLAVGFCRELALRVEEMKGALATWQDARDAAEAARDAVEPAKKRAWAAQLQDASDANELTGRFEEARAGVDRRHRERVAAKERVRDAVENAESDVLRVRSVTLSVAATASVKLAVHETQERARAARAAAGLGPSAEDEAARRSADALARATVPTEPPRIRGADAGSTTDVPRKKRRAPSEPKIVIIDGVEMVVGVDSMLLVLRSEHVGCRLQVLIDALNKPGTIEGAVPFGEGKNAPWAAPRRALVAWGRARRHLPVAP